MQRLGKEKLSDFVRRVVKRKQLRLRDVERRAGGEITNGYISGIINGRINNVSLGKLKALAKGLEVDVHELFSAAMDEPRQAVDITPAYAQPDMHLLLSLMQEVIANPDMMKLLHELVQMTPRDRQIVAKVSETILKNKRPARRPARRKPA